MKIRHAVFLYLASLIAFGSEIALHAQPAAPNVIFILTDDLGAGDIGPYGQQTIQTPNLDAMAASGMTFSNMYSGAPVCSPSRATLFTGLHNGRLNNGNGVNLNAGTPTTAQTLREAGYATGMFGKLHLGGANRLWGFDEFYGITDGVAAWDHFRPTMERGVAGPDGRISNIVNEANNGGYTDDLVGGEAVGFVRDHAGAGHPFYAQVNFQIAHFDMEVPTLEPYTVNQPWPESRKIFASMVSRLDRLVGDIRNAVNDPNGDGNTADSIANNTVIVFASDNGTHIEPQPGFQSNHGPDIGFFSGDPHDPEFFDSNGITRGWKRDLYDGGIRSPFLVEWAGTVQAGSASDHYGDFSDVLPTLAEFGGGESPVGIDGESFAHVLTGDEPALPTTRDDRYFEFTGNANWSSTPSASRYALIRDGFKAIRFANGATELYDLENDPSESNNLYAQMPALADGMIADAVAQDTGPMAYRTWSGTGDYFDQNFAWVENASPLTNAVATVADGTAYAELSVEVLGLEIGGAAAPARLNVIDGSLSARNGVRVLAGGELHLEQTTVSTLRRVELFQGVIGGEGLVVGQVVNSGLIRPSGDRVDLPPRNEPPNVLAFDFTGVQDDAPLTATSVLDPSLQLISGLDFGPGTQPRSAGPDGFTGSDAGNEFNIGGFNTPSLSAAIANLDFLTYTVQPVAGMELFLDRVSFDLWRNGGNAANDYAILTSLDGFSNGDELAQLNNVFDSGVASTRTFTGVYTGGQSSSDPLEVRLYAWNANDNLASTHITAVSMVADFVLPNGNSASIDGPASNPDGNATTDPFGVLALQGDYFQQAGGTLAIDIGGVAAGVDRDRFAVIGNADLGGTLQLSTLNAYVPDLDERILVLEVLGTGNGRTGTFDEVVGVLRDGFAWAVLYEPLAVIAQAALRGDANLNGLVEQGDLNAVLANWGQTDRTWVTGDLDGNGFVEQADLNQVLNNWGAAAAPDFSGAPFPEPGTLSLLSLGGSGLFRRRAIRGLP